MRLNRTMMSVVFPREMAAPGTGPAALMVCAKCIDGRAEIANRRRKTRRNA